MLLSFVREALLLLLPPFFPMGLFCAAAFSPLFPDRKNGFQRYFDMLQRSCKCIPSLSYVCVCSAETTFPPSILSIYSVLFCTTVQQRPLYCCRQLLLWCTRHSSVFELASFAFDTLYVVFLPVFYDIAIFTEHEYICEKALKKEYTKTFLDIFTHCW